MKKSLCITDQELLDYAQDLVSEVRSREIEIILRSSTEMQERLNSLLKQTITGQHSIGEIWRNSHLSCPSRSTWGSYLLNLLGQEEENYLTFHLKTVNCNYCLSNLTDLEEAYQEQRLLDHLNKQQQDERKTRQQRFFQSSRGLLSHD